MNRSCPFTIFVSPTATLPLGHNMSFSVSLLGTWLYRCFISTLFIVSSFRQQSVAFVSLSPELYLAPCFDGFHKVGAQKVLHGLMGGCTH